MVTQELLSQNVERLAQNADNYKCCLRAGLMDYKGRNLETYFLLLYKKLGKQEE